jgi:hypothetical protein
MILTSHAGIICVLYNCYHLETLYDLFKIRCHRQIVLSPQNGSKLVTIHECQVPLNEGSYLRYYS